MKKLRIFSKSFVSLMSTTSFFFLRLDHFIQLLNTSSVIIGLEFVFSNLCLSVSEESALFVIPEESLFAHFLSCVSEFLEHSKFVSQMVHNGSPRSIMTDGRRQTVRFLRVIGSSSARIRERLADGDVIVVEGILGPLLDQGFPGVVFSSLRDVVVVGLITCERVVLGKSAKVIFGGGAQGICPPHPGRWSWRAEGRIGWYERRWWGRKGKWSRRRESHQTDTPDDTWNMRWDECGPTLEPCVCM